jgi:hypothetical protein
MDAKEFTKLLKSLTVPSGGSTGLTPDGRRHEFVWTKRGGHAGDKVVERVAANAIALGFRSSSSQTFNNTLGSMVGHGLLYELDGADVYATSTFGVLKCDNRFFVRITARCKPQTEGGKMELHHRVVHVNRQGESKCN